MKGNNMKKISITVIIIVLFTFAYLNYYRYAIPDTDGIDLVGKQALVTADNTLSLYEYVDKSKCKKGADTDNVYKIIYGTACVKITVIDSAIKDTLRSTAILSDTRIIYSKEEAGEYNIYLWKAGMSQKVKTYKVFNLGKFAVDYKAGKVKLTDDIKSQTGVIYKDRFRIIDENTLGFIDAMVYKVDYEKPVEVMARERTLNLSTGDESYIERERLFMKRAISLI
jgi:hypothetical protein